MAITDKDFQISSGRAYMIPVKSEDDIPADLSTVAVEENLIAHITGGGTLTYSPTVKEFKDDLGDVKKKVITEEKSTFKTKFITWVGATIAKLCQVADSTSAGGTEEIGIGGLDNFKDQDYLLYFVSDGTVANAMNFIMIGRSINDLSLALKIDDAAAPEMEFESTQKITDSKGKKRLVIMKRTDNSYAAPTLQKENND